MTLTRLPCGYYVARADGAPVMDMMPFDVGFNARRGTTTTTKNSWGCNS